MPSVLCFGDSNTWGAATVPRPDDRYASEERWPGVVRTELGAGWLVVEEGLGGRTSVSDDPVEGLEKNGFTYLLPCLGSHRPLDWVVIMLGTNDLKARFNKSPWEVAAGVGRLLQLARQAEWGRGGKPPEVLAVCPPSFAPLTEKFAGLFAGGVEKSRHLAPEIQKAAAANGARFLDANTVAKSSAFDGIHLDPDAQLAIGKAVAAEIRKVAE
jgi:lysophospholipase L1-like esterase